MPPPRTLTPTPAPTLLAPTLGPALLAPAPSPTRVALALTRWAGVARKGASPTLRPLPLKPLILSLTPAQVGRCLAREGCESPALPVTPTLAARASTRTARATRAESGTRAVPNRASRLQHGPWAPSAESGKKWGKTSKSKDRGLPTLFAAGPGRRRRGTERGTRAVQTEPRALNTAPGRREWGKVGKSGTIRIGGLPTLFAQPARPGRT